MRTEIEKINILSTEVFKAEEFIEDICSRNHLYNYFGSISMALSTAISMLNGKISVSFEKCVGGVVFSVSSKDEVFKDLDFEHLEEDTTNALFLVDSLSDGIAIMDNGKTLEISFLVNGIAPELAMQRNEYLRQYSSKEVLVK